MRKLLCLLGLHKDVMEIHYAEAPKPECLVSLIKRCDECHYVTLVWSRRMTRFVVSTKYVEGHPDSYRLGSQTWEEWEKQNV